MDPATQQLLELIAATARPGGAAWLEQAMARVRDGDDIAVLFPAVGRKLGRDALGAPAGARANNAELAAWRVDDAGRAVLFGTLKASQPDTFASTATELYQRGDARERVGVLRGLAVYGDDPALLPVVLDALRTNQGTIFEAALCENPYSSRFLPELEFRKNVLKAVFVGMSIRRVVDLEARADAELASSLIDYIEEREAATRSVLPELWPVVALHPPEGATAKIIGYLEHPGADHRIACAHALATIITNGGDRAPLAYLRSRANRETDAEVAAALGRALARCEA